MDGSVYGTTQEGGDTANNESSGYGTVFRLNPGTGYAVLHSFDPASGEGNPASGEGNPASGEGKYPNSGLIQGRDGSLYGSTEFGGIHNLGTLFRIRPDGTDYIILYNFDDNPDDGSYPKAPLVQASDGGLFGTTQFGGDYGFGTAFRLAPSPARFSGARVLHNKTMEIFYWQRSSFFLSHRSLLRS